MSLFNLPVQGNEEKLASAHPWAKTIKNPNAHLITRAHNSINNSVYPKPKQRKRSKKRETFTVYGDRVTREFIYCANIVLGLYKCRWKYYDAPIIRGYTSVEWPMCLNELKLRYGKEICSKSRVFVLYNGQYLGTDIELRKLVGYQYYYHVALNYQKESVNNFARFIKASGLYTDICPITCDNFIRLCCSKRGGYSGTPVHRIVKDGWIQCGGYGLKSVDMECENYIVPHDKRGVLGMANDGRHIDCSTQFYVLLQSCEWMQTHYTAFGQLIDGYETLIKIEEIKTFYEAPLANIIVYTAGVLNLDCRDIAINKGVNQYIDMHMDDLVEIGTFFYAMLMDKVYLEIEFREQQRRQALGEFEDDEDAFRQVVDASGNVIKKNINAKRRFMRKMEQMNAYFNKDQQSDTHKKMRRKDRPILTKSTESNAGDANNDFDVDEYVYEPEEYAYPQLTPLESASLPVPTKPYYLAFTDVSYPGEVDSNFDLKKFLKGQYCLENDLDPNSQKLIHRKIQETKQTNKHNAVATIISSYGIQCISFDEVSEDESSSSPGSSTSDDNKEVEFYIQMHLEEVSFSGPKIKNIAKKAMKSNPLQDMGSSEKFTDDDVRMIRLAIQDLKSRENKRVSISVTPWETHNQIKRRQTGFPTDMAKFKVFQRDYSSESDDDEEEDEMGDQADPSNVSKSVSMKPKEETTSVGRRPTAYIRPGDLIRAKKDIDDDEDEDIINAEVEEEERAKKRGKVRITLDPLGPTTTVHTKPSSARSPNQHGQYSTRTIQADRQSVLMRLLDEIGDSDVGDVPTLKNFKPRSETGSKKEKNTISDSELLFLRKDDNRKFLKPSNEDSMKNLLTINSERASPTEEIATSEPNYGFQSLRRLQWSKVRPMLTVNEYRRLNETRNKTLKINDAWGAKTRAKDESSEFEVKGDTTLYYTPRASLSEKINPDARKINTADTKKSFLSKSTIKKETIKKSIMDKH